MFANCVAGTSGINVIGRSTLGSESGGDTCNHSSEGLLFIGLADLQLLNQLQTI